MARMRDEMDREYRLEQAGEGQVSSFIAVIKERIAWMEQMGMMRSIWIFIQRNILLSMPGMEGCFS